MFVFQFEQDERDMEQIVEFGKVFPYAFPIQYSPSVCFLIIHHPDYAKTILATSREEDETFISMCIEINEIYLNIYFVSNRAER